MIVQFSLKHTEILIEDAENDDRDTRSNKEGIGGDMPASEDDTGVDDVCVPKHVHFTHGHQGHIMTVGHVGCEDNITPL